jgi:hypothetical protein
LTQKVEEFFIESKEAEEEVARWKEACELEVKAGKKEIEERDKMVNILFYHRRISIKLFVYSHILLIMFECSARLLH